MDYYSTTYSQYGALDQKWTSDDSITLTTSSNGLRVESTVDKYESARDYYYIFTFPAVSASRATSAEHEECSATITKTDSDGYSNTLMTFETTDRGRRHWEKGSTARITYE